MDRSSRLYRYIDRLFEYSLVFNVNQILLDGGKHAPVRQFLEDVSVETVIDLGCGPGNWAPLARGQYLGIDTSPNFVSTGRKRYSDDPNKRFLQADVTNLRLDESFDLAFMISVLHHLSDDETAQVLEWTARHTRYLFVLDLYPIDGNPLSRWLYHMDRGRHIRTPEAQRELITSRACFELRKQDDFYSWNRLYRHTMFLFESQGRGS